MPEGSSWGRIADAGVAEVRERNRIDEVVGEYVTLRRAGADSLKGLCPFHDEKTPSLHVRPSHGTFHCFGCEEGGSVFDFIMKVEGLDFHDAVERLAARVSVQLTYARDDSATRRERATRSRLLEVNRLAAEFYTERLTSPEALPAREFLAQRGFTQEIAGTFGCGFAPGGWDELTRHLQGRGFATAELVAAGVAREGPRGAVDRFRRRLLWPIRDLTGGVVGFGARRLFSDDRVEAKYLNTAETPLYRKSQALFGLDLAKREIAQSRRVIVVEGYTDVMAMRAAGILGAVAACGTAFGREHVAALRRLLGDPDGEAVFVFDGDEAGRQAALRAFEAGGFEAMFIAVAPDGLDPCELRHARGDGALRRLVAAREPLFAYAIRAEISNRDLGTAEGRVGALKAAVPMVAAIRDAALRDEYARSLAAWVGWEDTATVVRRVRETAGVVAARPRVVSAPGSGVEWVEREALKYALQEPSAVGVEFGTLPAPVFTSAAYRLVYAAILAAGGVAAYSAGEAWVDAVRARCSHQSLVTELAVETPRVPERGAGYVSGLIAVLRARAVREQVGEMKAELCRLSPLADSVAYRELFSDLVVLEGYYRELQRDAAGCGP